MQPTFDKDKVKLSQDVRKQVEAFFASGGKAYQAREGESGMGKGLDQAFVISRKKEGK